METTKPESILEDDGFICKRQRPYIMPLGHRHQDIELNALHSGWVEYLFGGGRIRLRKGQQAVFWAALPHQITAYSKDAEYQNIHLSLTMFLQWNLPGGLASRLLAGDIMVTRIQHPSWKQELFAGWNRDRISNDPESIESVLLELQGYFRRLSRSETITPGMPVPGGGGITQVDRMAHFVAERYTHAITAAEIAQAGGLNPAQAVILFRQHFGVTIHEFLTRHRLAQAQRLLAITSRKVLDIALESGFGSESQFYKVFQERCGCSPKDYRKSMQPK